MKVQKISSSMFKVVLTYNELKENNISIHSFLSNSSKAKKLVENIIEIVNENFHFTNNTKEITYSIFSFSNKVFVLILSKSNMQKTFMGISNTISFNSVIFKFEDLADCTNFLKFLKKYTTFNILFNLYEFQNKYYIKIDISCIESSLVKTFLGIISEFLVPIYLDYLSNMHFLESAKYIKRGYL